jgi:hypothetical protein
MHSLLIHKEHQIHQAARQGLPTTTKNDNDNNSNSNNNSNNDNNNNVPRRKV